MLGFCVTLYVDTEYTTDLWAPSEICNMYLIPYFFLFSLQAADFGVNFVNFESRRTRMSRSEKRISAVADQQAAGKNIKKMCMCIVV